MVILEAILPVFVNGRVLEAGSKFSCPSDFAAKLIENESAKLYLEEKESPKKKAADKKK